MTKTWATAAQAAPPVPPAPLAAEERFDRERALAAWERGHAQQTARKLGELEALVAKIEMRIDGLMTITLDTSDE